MAEHFLVKQTFYWKIETEGTNLEGPKDFPLERFKQTAIPLDPLPPPHHQRRPTLNSLTGSKI